MADLDGATHLRVARALLPRGQDAALHRRDHRRPGSGAWSSPPTTRPRRPPGAASGSCATRASRSSSPTARSPRAARLLNQAFRKHARVGRPWVLFKSAMTLDGKVATRTGDSQWISGEQSRELAHRWRAAVDAVVVGIGTALADDPQLTARPDGTPAEPDVQPRRVVFDSLARLPRELAARRPRPARCRSRWSSRARPARAEHRRARSAPARRSWSRRARTSRRACARGSTSSARGHQLGAAGGRAAPRGGVPRRRRDRRSAAVPRAAAARRQRRARPARGRRRRAHLRGAARARRSTARASAKTC